MRRLGDGRQRRTRVKIEMATTETRERNNQFVRDYDKGTVEFRHGAKGADDKRPVVGTFSLTGLSKDITRRLAVVGLSSVLTSRANDDGDPINNVKELYEGFVAGNWPESRRGQRGPVDEGIYHQALYELGLSKGKDITPERAAEVWQNLDDAKKDGLKKDAAFKALVNKVKADRALAKGGEVDVEW